MADERKVFPVETVLALIFGKGGDNAKNLASFLTGYTALSTDEEKLSAHLPLPGFAVGIPNS